MLIVGPAQSLSNAQLQLLQQAAQAQAAQAQAAKAEAAKVLAHATAQGTAGKTVKQGTLFSAPDLNNSARILQNFSIKTYVVIPH